MAEDADVEYLTSLDLNYYRDLYLGVKHRSSTFANQHEVGAGTTVEPSRTADEQARCRSHLEDCLQELRHRGQDTSIGDEKRLQHLSRFIGSGG